MRALDKRLEDDADRKRLTGERRERYIGGIWNRIRNKEARSRWRHSRESQLLGRFVGPIHEVREHKNPEAGVVFRQGNRWYHLPREEYRSLLAAAKEGEWRERQSTRQRERLDRQERVEIERGLRRVHKERRDEERTRLHAEREHRTRERQEQAQREQQQRDLRAFERQQYAEVVDIIKSRGGIRTVTSRATGRQYDKGEIATLPRSVRASATASRRGGGLTLDEARAEVQDRIPWLRMETPDDLVTYFDRHRDWRVWMAG